jgi:CheY-like chemotaxis protein
MRQQNTILYIEDDHATRVTMRQVLEHEGYDVLTAANGKAGLALMGCIERPQLILLDLKMPVMDGHEVLESLKRDRNFADIPVVLVSAHGTEEDTCRASGFLRKPFQLTSLLDIARKHCS